MFIVTGFIFSKMKLLVMIVSQFVQHFKSVVWHTSYCNVVIKGFWEFLGRYSMFIIKSYNFPRWCHFYIYNCIWPKDPTIGPRMGSWFIFISKGIYFWKINKLDQGLRRSRRRKPRRVNFFIKLYVKVMLCCSLIYSIGFNSTCF